MTQSEPTRSRLQRFTLRLRTDILPTLGMLLAMALAMVWVNN